MNPSDAADRLYGAHRYLVSDQYAPQYCQLKGVPYTEDGWLRSLLALCPVGGRTRSRSGPHLFGSRLDAFVAALHRLLENRSPHGRVWTGPATPRLNLPRVAWAGLGRSTSIRAATIV